MNIETLIKNKFFEERYIDNIVQTAETYGLQNLMIIPPISFMDSNSLNILFEVKQDHCPSVDDIVAFLSLVIKNLDFDIKLHDRSLLNKAINERTFNASKILDCVNSSIAIKELKKDLSLEEQFSAKKKSITADKSIECVPAAATPGYQTLDESNMPNQDDSRPVKKAKKEETFAQVTMFFDFLSSLDETQRVDAIENVVQRVNDQFAIKYKLQ